MKKLFLIMCACVGFSAMAQQADTSETKKNDRIDAVKVGFITSKLNLTAQEAEKFWVVYNKFEAEQKVIRKKQHELTKAFKENPNPTEKDADKYIIALLELRQNELTMFKNYIPHLKQVLPAKKIAILLGLEHEFKMQLLKRMKERKPHE